MNQYERKQSITAQYLTSHLSGRPPPPPTMHLTSNQSSGGLIKLVVLAVFCHDYLSQANSILMAESRALGHRVSRCQGQMIEWLCGLLDKDCHH